MIGPSGEWKEQPGTCLAVITRENNPLPVTSPDKGVIQELHTELEGCFVEAGTRLALLRHYLSAAEVVRVLLREALSLFRAPERAKYYFVPEVDQKVKLMGHRSISVQDGMELFVASRMKREITVCYQGPEGVIYEVYFQHNRNVDAGAPLIGVCPPDQRPYIEDVVSRVQMDWGSGD